LLVLALFCPGAALTTPHYPCYLEPKKKANSEITQIISRHMLIKKMRCVKYKQFWEAGKNELIWDLIKNLANSAVIGLQTMPLSDSVRHCPERVLVKTN
jgi:hypothetical protein